MLGLRQFSVQVVSRKWTGTRPGLGTKSDSTSDVVVDLGTYAPKVTLVSAKEIASSGGLYVDQDLRVGPLTPEFQTWLCEGTHINLFDPPVTPGKGFELFFKVTGPGYPDSGAWFKKLSQDTTKNFSYSFVLRKTAQLP